MSVKPNQQKKQERELPQVGAFLPPAFGPASWYGTGENMIPIYRSVKWREDDKDRITVEEESPSPSPEDLEKVEQ